MLEQILSVWASFIIAGASLWFSFGIGFYLGLSIRNPKGFVNASAADLIRGLLLGIVFWPIGLAFELYGTFRKFT